MGAVRAHVSASVAGRRGGRAPGPRPVDRGTGCQDHRSYGAGAEDEGSCRLPPRSGAVDRVRADDPRVRRRTGENARGAPRQDVTAEGRCRDAPVVQLRRNRRPLRAGGTGLGRVETTRAVGRGVGDARPRAIHPRISHEIARGAFRAPRSGGAHGHARRVRDRQGAVRGRLRAGAPARLVADPAARDSQDPGDGLVSADVERLVKGELRDPHSLLGKHPAPGDRTIVRAFRPEAQTVRVITNGEPAAKLESVHPAGLFEGTVDGTLGDYELEVGYTDGSTFCLRNPYAFLPTIGELDLHLAGEGTHTRLWEALGAHRRVIDDVDGVSFALWAPNARGVRVVGQFN